MMIWTSRRLHSKGAYKGRKNRTNGSTNPRENTGQTITRFRHSFNHSRQPLAKAKVLERLALFLKDISLTYHIFPRYSCLKRLPFRLVFSRSLRWPLSLSPSCRTARRYWALAPLAVVTKGFLTAIRASNHKDP